MVSANVTFYANQQQLATVPAQVSALLLRIGDTHLVFLLSFMAATQTIKMKGFHNNPRCRWWQVSGNDFTANLTTTVVAPAMVDIESESSSQDTLGAYPLISDNNLTLLVQANTAVVLNTLTPNPAVLQVRRP